MPDKPKYTRNPDDQCDESCPVCLRHFTSKKQLGKHLAFHDSRHDIKAPMNCPACGIECTKATLNGHYREHHNAGKSYSIHHASIRETFGYLSIIISQTSLASNAMLLLFTSCTASSDRPSNVGHRIGASALEGDWPPCPAAPPHVSEILVHLGRQRELVAPQPLQDHVAFCARCRGPLLLGDWLWRRASSVNEQAMVEFPIASPIPLQHAVKSI